MIMPALADKSGARSGGLAAAPPTAIWRNKIEMAADITMTVTLGGPRDMRDAKRSFAARPQLKWQRDGDEWVLLKS